MQSIDSALYRVALHESAHAIAAHVLGCDVTSLSIIRDGTTLGRCEHLAATYYDKPQTTKAAICLAGYVAEMQQYGEASGYGLDMMKALHMTGCSTHVRSDKRLTFTPTRRYDDALALAEDIIMVHAAALDDLARQLMRQRLIINPLGIHRLLDHLIMLRRV